MWIYRIAFRQNSHMQIPTWLVLNVSTLSLPPTARLPPPRSTRHVRVESFDFRYLRTLPSLRAGAPLHTDTPAGEKVARAGE